MKILRPLLNGAGSKEMNVNGSMISPVIFSFSPLSGNHSKLTRINFTMIDEGAATVGKFGAINVLTNGILIRTNIGGVTFPVAILKDNGDLTTHFSQPYFGSGAVLSLLGIITPLGFLNTNNAFIAGIDLRAEQNIILSSSDSVEVLIRDNLTAIDFLRMTVELETQL